MQYNKKRQFNSNGNRNLINIVLYAVTTQQVTRNQDYGGLIQIETQLRLV